MRRNKIQEVEDAPKCTEVGSLQGKNDESNLLRKTKTPRQRKADRTGYSPQSSPHDFQRQTLGKPENGGIPPIVSPKANKWRTPPWGRQPPLDVPHMSVTWLGGKGKQEREEGVKRSRRSADGEPRASDARKACSFLLPEGGHNGQREPEEQKDRSGTLDSLSSSRASLRILTHRTI